MPTSDLFLGLDLGQASDPTALVVLRRTPILDEDGTTVKRSHRGKRLFAYECPHLERYPLGTSYPTIVEAVKELLERPELQPAPHLAIDATGVGRAVVDLLLDAKLPAICTPITITGGVSEGRRDKWNPSGLPYAYWVPKVQLVSSVQAVLSSGRLKVAPKLPLAETLKAELLNFKVKISAAANESFGAWREGQHDDLVLALAMALWLGDETDYRAVELGQAVSVPRLPSRTQGLYGQPGRTNPDREWNRSTASAWDQSDDDEGTSQELPLEIPRRPRRNFYGR